MLRERGWTWSVALGAMLCVTASLPYWSATDGDAAIYFTFFLRFFERPFSYAPGEVSFGATSPLHVLVFSPIHAMFGEWWIYVAKALNFGIVLYGAFVLGRATGKPSGLLGAFVAVAATPQLMENTFDVFEVGLVFLVGALTIAALYREEWKRALLWVGFGYLARPELLLATVTVAVFVWRRERSWGAFRWLCPGLAAAVAYHLWMAAHGAGWIPTSVAGRLHRVSGEVARPWTERFMGSYAQSWVHPEGIGLIAPLLALGLGFFVWAVVRRNAIASCSLAFGIGVVALFVVLPPGFYASRYLLDVAPAFVGLAAVGASAMRVRWLAGFGVVLALLTVRAEWGLPNRWREHAPLWARDLARFRNYRPADDLAQPLNGLAKPGERVLVYEIQAQYGTHANLVSMDGIVGVRALRAYAGAESWADMIRRENIRWVVLNQALVYRPAFRGTLLEAVYLGNVVESEGVAFSLTLRNPRLTDAKFAEPGTYGPVFNEGAGLERGIPVWDAIYEVQTLSFAD